MHAISTEIYNSNYFDSLKINHCFLEQRRKQLRADTVFWISICEFERFVESVKHSLSEEQKSKKLKLIICRFLIFLKYSNILHLLQKEFCSLVRLQLLIYTTLVLFEKKTFFDWEFKLQRSNVQLTNQLNWSQSSFSLIYWNFFFLQNCRQLCVYQNKLIQNLKRRRVLQFCQIAGCF